MVQLPRVPVPVLARNGIKNWVSALHYAHGPVDQDHTRLALDTGNHLSWSLSDDFLHCWRYRPLRASSRISDLPIRDDHSFFAVAFSHGYGL